MSLGDTQAWPDRRRLGERLPVTGGRALGGPGSLWDVPHSDLPLEQDWRGRGGGPWVTAGARGPQLLSPCKVHAAARLSKPTMDGAGPSSALADRSARAPRPPCSGTLAVVTSPPPL